MVDNSTPRKAKQQETAAQRVLADLLHSFVPPAEQNAVNKHEQLFTDTAKEWMARQLGAKAPSTVAGYQYIINDIVCYFSEVKPICTVELTSAIVEDYLTWERQRRQKDYKGPHKRNVQYKMVQALKTLSCTAQPSYARSSNTQSAMASCRRMLPLNVTAGSICRSLSSMSLRSLRPRKQRNLSNHYKMNCCGFVLQCCLRCC